MVAGKNLKFGLKFNLKLAKRFTYKRVGAKSTKLNKISRLCKATVVEVDGQLKAKVNLNNEDHKIMVIPFTESAFDLKDKVHIFSKTKDKYGHYIRIIRSKEQAHNFPGDSNLYQSLVPNLRVVGYIIDNDGKHLFDIKEVIGKGNAVFTEFVYVNDDKPVLKQ